ncbi:hypothetical protein FEM48_Zijuj11G0076200 [Ziziphus jujuba var. spinosa]|uniref:SNF2 domain-containing protein CLASSY 3-like n=1 Tax=Ziziphus jujuba var. spinosa TaxID=714518 RepID=A0A978UHN7_ZIZJJ|nr:hypothetical protein FEM48_Zijuj11G0076200 [Ziziphus jujuba var. spinosa]
MVGKRKRGDGSEKLESDSVKDYESTASVDDVKNSHMAFKNRAEEWDIIDVDDSDDGMVSVNDSDSDSGSKSLEGKKEGDICEPQRTASQFNVTSGKEKMEPGSASHPFCIDDDDDDDGGGGGGGVLEPSSSDSEDVESSSTENNDDEDSDSEYEQKSSPTEDDDDDNTSEDDDYTSDDEDTSDDDFNVKKTSHHRKKARSNDKIVDVDTDENGHRLVRKTGFDREKCVYDPRKKMEYVKKGFDDELDDCRKHKDYEKKCLDDDDELELEKPKKKKEIGVNVKKNYNASKILMDSILERGEVNLEELLSSRNKDPQAETNPSGDETVLPLKFTFGVEEPKPPEISDFDRELERLWAEYAFALRSCEIGSGQQVENEDFLPPEKEVDIAFLCSRGKHQLVLDEEIGLRCTYCSFVELEIKYCVPEFCKNPWGRSDARELGKSDNSSFFEFQKEFGCDSHFDCGFYDHADGTVWDLIPGTRSSMFPHQREGFEFIWNKIAGSIDLETLKKGTGSDGGSGCIISHAPGTGKTRLTIIFLQTYMKLYPNCKPMIIAPPSMLLTWEEEFQKWNVDIPIHNLSKAELSGMENDLAVSLLFKKKKHVNRERDVDVNGIRWAKLYSWCKKGGILGISYPLFEQLAGKRNKPDGKKGWKKCKDAEDERARKRKTAECEEFSKVLLEYPGLVVFDEGHTPRNEDSLIWKAVSEIQTKKRILLSGTPFQNNFNELFNTLCLVQPDFEKKLEDACKEDSDRKYAGKRKNRAKLLWSRFTSSIGKGEDEMEDANLKTLRVIIDRLAHVHNGNILQEHLPGLRSVLVKLKPAPLQERVIEDIQRSTNYFRRQYEETLASIHPSLLLTRVGELSVSEDDLKRDKMNPHAGVKTKFLIELIQLSEALNEKVLVFSQFLDPLNFIKDLLRSYLNWHEDREVMCLDGNCDIKQRHSSLKVFNDPSSEAKVLLASTKACGEGINLVGASRVVLLDVEWNPSVERQAICRAFRVGQKKFVYTYHLITSGSNEEEKNRRQAEKDRQSKLIFCTSDKANEQQKVQATACEDKILEEMVRHEKLRSMFVELAQQKSNLMEDKESSPSTS